MPKPLGYFENKAIKDAARKGEPYKGLNPIVWAIKNDFTINSQKANWSPINWAIKNRINIDAAVNWAIKNNIQINGKNALDWVALYNKDAIEKDARPIKIEGKDLIVYAIENTMQINGESAIEFAVRYNMVNDDVIFAAIEKGLTINGKSVLEYAVLNNVNILGQHAIYMAISRDGTTINGKHPLEYMVLEKPTITAFQFDPLILAAETGVEIAGVDAIVWAVKNGALINNQHPLQWANEHNIAYDKKKVLEIHFKEKNTGVRSEFTHERAKQGGTSSKGGEYSRGGEIYTKKTELKDAKKNIEQSPIRNLLKVEFDMSDSKAEYIMAPMFQRFLQNRAPEIQLAVQDKEMSSVEIGKGMSGKTVKAKEGEGFEEFHITSKHFKKFTTLLAFKGDKSKIGGFEKVFAACMILGEVDPNPGNIGIVNHGTTDKPIYLAVKIDHGKSGRSHDPVGSYADENTFRKYLLGYLNKDSTSPRWYDYADMSFNLNEFRSAIDEMVKIGEDEIRTLLASREYNLKKAGFIDHDGNTDIGDTRITDRYAERILKNIELAKRLSKTLEILSKIDGAVAKNGEKEWLDKKWLKEVGDHEPIYYAYLKGHTISGKNPIEYALDPKNGVPPHLAEWLFIAVHKGDVKNIEAILNIPGVDKKVLFDYRPKQDTSSSIERAINLCLSNGYADDYKKILDKLLESDEGKTALLGKDGKTPLLNNVLDSENLRNNGLVEKLLESEIGRNAFNFINMGLIEKSPGNRVAGAVMTAEVEFNKNKASIEKSSKAQIHNKDKVTTVITM